MMKRAGQAEGKAAVPLKKHDRRVLRQAVVIVVIAPAQRDGPKTCLMLVARPAHGRNCHRCHAHEYALPASAAAADHRVEPA